MEINIKDLRTYKRYATENTTPEQPLSEVRIRQLVADKRLKNIIVDGRQFIHKDAVISPSKAVLERAKKMKAFEKSRRK